MDRITSLQKLVVWLFILLSQSQPVLAEPNDRNRSWQLRAKPHICVTPSNQLMCKMETNINWIGYEQADICLLSSQENTALQCWTHAFSGEIVQKIVSDKQITYWLSRPNHDEVLVKAIIRIVRIPQRPIRKRRRHIWSLL